MKGPDAGLRKLMAVKLQPHGFWFQAIETGSTSAGLPDSHVLGPTGTLWVESKRTDGWAVKFEAHQLMWWRRHHEWVRGFIAVRTLGVGSSEGTGDGLRIYRGAQADELEEKGVEHVEPLLKIVGGYRGWNWITIAALLRG